MSDASDRRVGDLLIRATSLESDDVPYRSQVGSLRIERPKAAAASFEGPGLVTILIALLSAVLLAFALIVRSWPAVGAVSLTIAALGWLVLRGRDERGTRWVELGAGKLSAGGEGEPVELALDEVSDVGIGVDGAYRSLFVLVEGAGRVALLYGLKDAEAEAAQRSLREVLDARRG